MHKHHTVGTTDGGHILEKGPCTVTKQVVLVDRKVKEHMKCYISSTKNQINCIVSRSTNEAEEKPLIKIHFKHTLALKHAESHYFLGRAFCSKGSFSNSITTAVERQFLLSQHVHKHLKL